MRILVTGGGGLVGSHVVDRLMRDGHHVTSVSKGRRAPGEGLVHASREIDGDASDSDLVASALHGIDAVAHLAAIPAPGDLSLNELLVANAVTTSVIFEQCAKAGVSGVAYASSTSVLGRVFAPNMPPAPSRIPVGVAERPYLADGYALSKLVDEATAQTAWNRWGLPSVGIRLPFCQSLDEIRKRSHDQSHAESFARELWAYLDVRDAALAFSLALARLAGAHVSAAEVLFVAADDVIVAERTLGDLVASTYPEIPFDASATCAYDLSRAEQLLGFRASHFLADAEPANERNR
jgi:nucleoside-diphosphate-sugar epimerase